MNIREILREVRRIELAAKKRVTSQFSGQYQSAFRGSGMQFADTRAYVPGDDARHIAWNISTRSPVVQVKQYEEERELNVLLAVDISLSRDYGGEKATVARRQAIIAATLAMAAVNNQDYVGAALFAEKVESAIPFEKGLNHSLRVVRDILAQPSQAFQSRLDGVLLHIEKRVRRRSVVFLLSDFIVHSPPEALVKKVARKHEIIAVCVSDPFEDYLPRVGLLRCRDPETGREAVIDTSSKSVQERWRGNIQTQRIALFRMLQRYGVDVLQLDQPKQDGAKLSMFFQRRSFRTAARHAR